MPDTHTNYFLSDQCSDEYHPECLGLDIIAPDKAAYCAFTQFGGPENAIKFISVRTKTQ